MTTYNFVTLVICLLLSLLLPERGISEVLGCRSHNDCSSNLSCTSSGSCEDLCVLASCGENSTCVTTNHSFSCQCLPDYYRIDLENTTASCQAIKFDEAREESMGSEGVVTDGSLFLHCRSSFTFKTLSLGVEVLGLRIRIYEPEPYVCSVTVESLNTPQNLNITVASGGILGHEVMGILPVSTVDRQVLLSPNSNYNMTVSCNRAFSTFMHRRPVINLEYMTIELEDFMFKSYVSPVEDIVYKTWTTQ